MGQTVRTVIRNNKSISYQLSAISGQQTGKLLQTSLLRKLFTVHYSLFTNKKGLTLVEVLIAMVVLLLVFLALMQTALVSINANMTNVLRDEAVGIAEMRMSEYRNASFDSLTDTNGASNSLGSFVSDPPVVQRNVRNISNFTFTVTKRIDDISTDNKQIDIKVSWDWKENTAANNSPYTHTISTLLRRQ